MNTVDIYADNPEVTLEYMIAVMQAAKAGGTVQWKRTTDALYGFWENTKCPNWDWLATKYRISPDSRPKKIVPMGRDDYPPVFWVRRKSQPDLQCLVTCINLGWVYFDRHLPGIGADATFYLLSGIDVALPRPCEYSVDRKTWLPCTKEVSA